MAIIMRIIKNRIVKLEIDGCESSGDNPAPKLKGRPRRKRKKRSVSPGESSNESEASVASSAAASTSKGSSSSSGSSSNSSGPGIVVPAIAAAATVAINATAVAANNANRRNERKPSAEEKKFFCDVHTFMNSRNTPLGKIPLLGYRQIDLFMFYSRVQDLGGYDRVSANRLWKSIYDEMGGNVGSTSAATITRRHYERLLLPYERCQKGEESKVKPNQGGRRIKTPSISDASEDSIEVKREAESPPPSETPPPSEASNSTTLTIPPLQSILSTSVPPSCSPTGLPVSTVVTNATTVVTLTPPPEKDMKEIKLDPKQTSLLAQGKENIPLFEEKSPIFVDKVAPRSPEVIDLETETETGARDKLIIPSFKKRKLEKLREGGLEVTAVDYDNENNANTALYHTDARPSVIQSATTTTTTTTAGAFLSTSTTMLGTPSSCSTAAASPSPLATASITTGLTSPVKQEDKYNAAYNLPPAAVLPKLINVTVTPDIGHILPRPEENHHPASMRQQQQMQQQLPAKPPPTNDSPPPHVNSRIINLGTSNNANLLQLYANANMPVPQSLSAAAGAQRYPVANGRPQPPRVLQSRSIFGNSDKMVYGNPKEILVPPKFTPASIVQSHKPRYPSVQPGTTPRCGEMQSPSGALDLTQKACPGGERAGYARPNLEIVRVPVVPRPNPLNLETHHRSIIAGHAGGSKEPLMNSVKPPISPTCKVPPFVPSAMPPNPAAYPNVLDSRTMSTNNLEITLMPPSLPVQRRQQQQQQSPQTPPQHHLNGKFPSRLPAEPISPYTPRKTPSTSSGGGNTHHPVIPNVPNLSHLNANAAATGYAKANQVGNYHQMAMEKRKAAAIESNKEHQRRISEGDKMALQQQQQQQQQRLEASTPTSVPSPKQQQQSRESEAASRRHSVPSLPTGFIPGLPASNPAFLAHQLAAASNGSAVAASSPAALAAAAAAAGKFLPMLDPMYSAYSAFYNGLLPGPMPTNAAVAGSPFLPPEISAYYKELLASSSSAQQTRLAMAAGQQHQPAAPTSK